MEKSTKELGEVVKFVCAVANAIGEAVKDGEGTVGDAIHLMPLLYKLPAAIDGCAEIPAELADLSQGEIDQLAAFVKDELDLPQKKVEAAIEDAIDISVKIYGLVKKFRD